MKCATTFGGFAQICLLTFFMQATFSNLWAQEPGNVLLIIADDLGKDYMKAYGASEDLTPNIDQLFDQGIVFHQAWSNPVCSPTRATIATGRYGSRTGVGWVTGSCADDVYDNNGDPVPCECQGINMMNAEAEFTIGKALDYWGAQNGQDYGHAVIGKWHLGDTLTHPQDSGYGYYTGLLAGALGERTNCAGVGRRGSYWHWKKVTNDGSAEAQEETLCGDIDEDNPGPWTYDETYATHVNVKDALAWIEAQGSRPWFCQVAFNAPHAPYHLPPRQTHTFQNLQPRLVVTAGNQDSQDYYRAMIESMDFYVDQLLDGLPNGGANTTVIFIGDNGSPGPMAQDPYDVLSAKATLYEGGINVPMVIRRLGDTEQEPNDIYTPVNMTDIYNTVLELMGVVIDDLPADKQAEDSHSLRPYITGNGEAQRYYQYSEALLDGPLAGLAASDGIFKLIRRPNDSGGYDDELYQLPNETINLVNSNLSAVQNAYADLVAYIDSIVSDPANTGACLENH